MKKLTALALAAVFCLAAVCSAFAADGDAMIMHLRMNEGYISGFVDSVLLVGNDIYAFMDGEKQIVRVYAGAAGEPAEYELEPAQSPDPAVSGESGEEPQENHFTFDQNLCWFAWNDMLLVLQARTVSNEDSSRVEGGFVKKVVLRDGKVLLEDSGVPQLDWTDMVEDYGTWSSTRALNNVFVSGDTLYGQTWDDSGTSLIMAFDLNSGLGEQIFIPELSDFYPGPDNSIIVTRYEWGEEVKIHVVRFDLDSRSEEEIGTLSGSYNAPQGFCWDAASETLYYLFDGEIYAAPGMNMDAAAAVTDCPVTNSPRALLLGDGRMLIWGQGDLMIRSLDPAARANKLVLTVQDYAYGDSITETNFDFTSARGDTSVILKRDGDYSDILQAMMNQDASVDVYTLPYSSSQFDALRNRGYLADLGGNAALSAAVDRMYPYMRDALMKDGKLIAVPVSLYGGTVGVREDLLESIGMTWEELPKTWDQFFDWLNELPAKTAGKDVKVFDMWMSKSSVRWELMSLIVNQYQAVLNEGGRDYAFNTPLLTGLLKRLDDIDYEGLGIRDGEQDEASVSDMEYREPLIDLYAQLTITSWSSRVRTLPLSLEEGADPILPLSMNVAFVNPYSTHQAEAAEYLSYSLNNLQTATRYSVFTDLTEPIRDPYYLESKKNTEQYLAEAKKSLEAAEEDSEREMWQQVMDNYEESLQDLDKNSWMISEQEIEHFRSRASFLKPLNYDFTTTMFSDKEGSGNYYELADGFSMGTVSVEELLSTIDKKVQMIRLEGN